MSDKTDDRRKLEEMTAAFLAKGGSVTKHPPGGSETIVYKYGRGRPAKKEQKPTEGTKPAGEG